jgi:hypothetical protein
LGGDRGNLPAVAKKRAKASLATRQQWALDRARDLGGVIEELRSNGYTSLRQIAAGLNERDIGAPRGGIWRVGQVASLLRRIADG